MCGGARFLQAVRCRLENRGVNMPRTHQNTNGNLAGLQHLQFLSPYCFTEMRSRLSSCLFETQCASFSKRLTDGVIAGGCMAWLGGLGARFHSAGVKEMRERSGSGLIPPPGLLQATILNPSVLGLNITSTERGFVAQCDRQPNKSCKAKEQSEVERMKKFNPS